MNLKLAPVIRNLCFAASGAMVSYSANAVVAGSYDANVTTGISAYYVVVINESDDDIFLGNKSQFRYNNGNAFEDIWADITSMFNEEWVGTDPDFIRPNEMAMGSNIFFDDDEKRENNQYEVMTTWQNTGNYDFGTFGMDYRYSVENEYANMEDFYVAAPWNTFSSALNYFNDHEANFELRLEYGCREGNADYTDVDASDNLAYSPHFDKDLALSGGKTSTGGAFWSEHQGNKYVVYAIVNDCNGDVSWGHTFYEAYNKSRGLKDSKWSAWTNANQSTQTNDSSNESEPVPSFCAKPKEIQCRKNWQGDEFSEFRNMAQSSGISGAFVYSCDIDRGLQCSQSEQKKDLKHWQTTGSSGRSFEPGTLDYKQSCGDWEVRVRCDNNVDTGVDLSESTSDTINFDTPAASGNHDNELIQRHLEAGNISPQHASVEPAYIEIKGVEDGVRPGDSHKDDELFARTTYGAVVYNSAGEPASQDYEVTFHYGWTPWLNENSTLANDKEWHWKYTVWEGENKNGNENKNWRKGLMPNRDPEKIECRATGYSKTFSNSTATSSGYITADMGDGVNRKFQCNTEEGYTCNANDNPNGGCIDAEARYYFNTYKVCNGNIDDGLDNSLCDGSSGTVSITPYLAPELCAVADNEGATLGLRDCDLVNHQWVHDQTTGYLHPSYSRDLCISPKVSGGNSLTTRNCAERRGYSFDYNPANGKFNIRGFDNQCLGVVGEYNDASKPNHGITAGLKLVIEQCAITESLLMTHPSGISLKSPALTLNLNADSNNGVYSAVAGRAYSLVAEVPDSGGAIEYLYWDLDGDGNYASAQLANYAGEHVMNHSWQRVGEHKVFVKGVNSRGSKVTKSVAVSVTGTPDIELTHTGQATILDEIRLSASVADYGLPISLKTWFINGKLVSEAGLEVTRNTADELIFKAPDREQNIVIEYLVGVLGKQNVKAQTNITILQDVPTITKFDYPQWVEANSEILITLEAEDQYGYIAEKHCEIHGDSITVAGQENEFTITVGSSTNLENELNCFVVDDDGNEVATEATVIPVYQLHDPQLLITGSSGLNNQMQTSINDHVTLKLRVTDQDSNLALLEADLDGNGSFESVTDLSAQPSSWSGELTSSWSTPGRYNLSLKVTDITGRSYIEPIQIEVIEDAPVVAIDGLSGLPLYAKTSLTLNGTAMQEFGSLNSQKWVIESNTGTEQVTDTDVLVIPQLEVSDYSVTYLVEDDDGNKAQKSVQFKVLPNQPPKLFVTVQGLNEHNQASINDRVVIDVIPHDDENALKNLQVDLDGDGVFESTMNVKSGNPEAFHQQWTSATSINLSFKLTDTAGQSVVEVVPVSILLDAPTANIQSTTIDALIPSPSNRVFELHQFDALVSNENFGEIVSYQWSVSEAPYYFRSNSISLDNPKVTRYENSTSIQHQFMFEGTQTVTLEVEDDDGNKSTASVEVIIENKGTEFNWNVSGLNSAKQASINDPVQLDFSWHRQSSIGFFYCQLNGDSIIKNEADFKSYQAAGTAASFYTDELGRQYGLPYSGTIRVTVVPENTGSYRLNCGVEESFISRADSAYEFDVIEDKPEIAIDGLSDWQSAEPVTLTAVVVKEEFGHIADWQWVINRDNLPVLVASGPEVVIEPEPGTYSIELTATDDDGNVTVLTESVSVENNAPEITISKVTGYKQGSEVYLDGTLLVTVTASDIDNNLIKAVVDQNGDGEYEIEVPFAADGSAIIELKNWQQPGQVSSYFKAVDSFGAESPAVQLDHSVLDKKLYDAEVWGHDKFYGSASRSQVRMQLKNTGDAPLTDIEIRYYFTADNDKTMKAQSAYSGGASFDWGHLGGDDYYASFSLTGTTIEPGEVSPRGSYYEVLAHYSDWSDSWQIENDCSYSGVDSEASDSLLTHIAVYSQGRKIAGQSCDDFSGNEPAQSIDLYLVNVGSGDGSGEYQAGEVVTINANNAAIGYQFTGWQGNVALADSTSANTTFVMPTHEVQLTAMYEAIADSGSCSQPGCDQLNPVVLGERSSDGVELELSGTTWFVVKADTIPRWLQNGNITLVMKPAGDGAMNGVVLSHSEGSYLVPDGKWYASTSVAGVYPNDLVFSVTVAEPRKLAVDWF